MTVYPYAMSPHTAKKYGNYFSNRELRRHATFLMQLGLEDTAIIFLRSSTDIEDPMIKGFIEMLEDPSSPINRKLRYGK